MYKNGVLMLTWAMAKPSTCMQPRSSIRIRYCSKIMSQTNNLTLLVLRSNSHTTRESKHTELKPYSCVELISKLGSQRRPICG